MPHTTLANNPFMLLLNPEVVIAAMERSERLSQLNRHLCRPLDRPVLPGGKGADDAGNEMETDGDEAGSGAGAAAI